MKGPGWSLGIGCPLLFLRTQSLSRSLGVFGLEGHNYPWWINHLSSPKSTSCPSCVWKWLLQRICCVTSPGTGAGHPLAPQVLLVLPQAGCFIWLFAAIGNLTVMSAETEATSQLHRCLPWACLWLINPSSHWLHSLGVILLPQALLRGPDPWRAREPTWAVINAKIAPQPISY